MLVRFLTPVFLLWVATAPPVHAQRTHQVKLIHARGDQFRFEPIRVNARPGEVLEFVVESGGPYVVGFEAADLSPGARALLEQAIPNPSGALRGPVLPGPRSSFRLILPGLPKGSYRFTSVTHVAYRMGGILVIQ